MLARVNAVPAQDPFGGKDPFSGSSTGGDSSMANFADFGSSTKSKVGREFGSTSGLAAAVWLCTSIILYCDSDVPFKSVCKMPVILSFCCFYLHVVVVCFIISSSQTFLYGYMYLSQT